MSNNVYANGNAIACKSGDDKVIAAFPDVCLSPPSPPAGPIPVPYPDTSFSKDMQNGSNTVKINGGEVMLKDKSFYRTSPLGDEAATNGLGANVVSHVITGKTYFRAWSMDVKFEGENVDRHLDITTSNHASEGPGEPTPLPAQEDFAPSSDADKPKCPCCHGELHDNQKNPDTGEPYEQVSEQAYYEECVQTVRGKASGISKWLDANKARPDAQATAAKGYAQLALAEKDAKTYQDARAKQPPCPNLHDPADTECGVHFKKTHKEPRTGDTKVRKKLGFTDGVRDQCIKRYQAMHDADPSSCNRPSARSSVGHKTPLAAGGCPSKQDNLIPVEALSSECQEVEEAQTRLQVFAGRS